ncbi:MAG TPA: (d)CMP kinase [Firmicutes bacterium]|jgi:cytidylate kinase|nr:(d)CMP kinase [Bacillota bacterium]HOQ23995.1 (d)CMP kinase [Bacillota bacterium]HPT67394.1 (d)CMP kinase [Bacillota bacterium]
MKKLKIAIDGPAGSGKSTVAKRVAEALNYIYVDTGAMYRAVTLAALRKGVSMDDGEGLTELSAGIQLEFRPAEEGKGYRLYMDGEDVHEEIRSLEVTNNVSFVAAVAGVRRNLVRLQQSLTSGGGVVMEGRDIGTVVMPDAEVKVFLTASVAARTRRRLLELQAKGIMVNEEELQASIIRRDAIDSGREVDPLRPAPDSFELDTTELNIDQVVERILALALAKGARLDQ